MERQSDAKEDALKAPLPAKVDATPAIVPKPASPPPPPPPPAPVVPAAPALRPQPSPPVSFALRPPPPAPNRYRSLFGGQRTAAYHV